MAPRRSATSDAAGLFSGDKAVMRAKLALMGLTAFLSIAGPAAPALADAKTDIKVLADRFVAAVKAKDVDAIMKVYVPDQSLFVFDVTPPRQYVGAAAYRKDWEDLLNDIEGPIKFEITDLAVTVDGNIGYSHSIQAISGKNKRGDLVDLTVRVTDAYRK